MEREKEIRYINLPHQVVLHRCRTIIEIGGS